MKDLTHTQLLAKLAEKDKQIAQLERLLYQSHHECEIIKYIVSISPAHLYWKDKKGVILGCNEEQAKTLGYQHAKDIIGKTDFDLFSKEYAASIQKIDQEIMVSGEIHSKEEISTLPDGRVRTYFSTKRPLYNPETKEVMGAIGISIDITELKLAQEQERLALMQAIEAKAQAEAEETLRNTIMVFADAIAHNQRTPLTVMSSIASNFERILPILLQIYDDAKRLGSEKTKLLKERDRLYITENIGINALHRAVTTMHENIDSNLQSLHVALKARTSTLSQEDLKPCNIDDNLKLIESNYAIKDEEKSLIHIDRTYIFDYLGSTLLTDQIFTNLIQNSLYQIRKYQRGEIFVTAENDGEFNIVRFRDTAGGAPPEVIACLFDTHFTTKMDGNGVGLAYCKSTMNRFGGDISCHSVYGDYIEFVLSFPQLA